MIIPYQRHGRLVGQYLFVCLDGKVSQDLRLIILHIYIYKRLQLGTAKNPLVEVEDDNDRGERSFFLLNRLNSLVKGSRYGIKKTQYVTPSRTSPGLTRSVSVPIFHIAMANTSVFLDRFSVITLVRKYTLFISLLLFPYCIFIIFIAYTTGMEASCKSRPDPFIMFEL